MSADTLHAAADRLRELAQAATPGPWDMDLLRFGCWEVSAPSPNGGDPRVFRFSVADRMQERDAEYVSTLAPPVALAVADLLDAEANRTNTCRPCDRPDCEATDCRAIRAALAVAEAIGGTA